jgi:dipeptidase D
MINIDAKLFWDEFYSLCQIPRASHYPDKIIPYLKNKIKLYGFEPIIDKNNNIFFTIPATNGYEKSPITLLQAHADMVGVKTKNSSHDFKNDAIKTLNNNGKLSAQDTSLGADNGIGLAYILTIVSQNKNLIHPTLEILIT